MRSGPQFLRRTQREAIHTMEEAVQAAADGLPPTRTREPGNPIDRAHDEMAASWDQLNGELMEARQEVREHRNELALMSAEVDRLRKELETRTAFYELEVERLTVRADRATEALAGFTARFTLIRDTLSAVLGQAITAPQPQAEPPIAVVATVRTTPTPMVREHLVIDPQAEQDDANNIADIFDRLPKPRI